MTTPEMLTVLSVAVQICDENGGGASAGNIAQRLGVNEGVVTRDLLPDLVGYFGEKLAR